jgi:hypothetical protein
MWARASFPQPAQNNSLHFPFQARFRLGHDAMFFASAYSPNAIKCWTDLLYLVLPNGLAEFYYRVGACWRLAGSYKGTSGYGPQLMEARGLV